MHKPKVLVALFTYNHGAYIEECLGSIVEQNGNFELQVIIFDDASTDDTGEKIISYLASCEVPSHISIKYNRSTSNLGVLRSFRNMIRSCELIKADFFTIIEGDDYWLPGRIQAHIDFMDAYPQAAVTFNQLKFFIQETKQFSAFEIQQNLHGVLFNGCDLAAENFMANNSCAFIRHEYLSKVPNALFDFWGTDWLFYLWLTQYGLVGYVKEICSVYRIHNESTWTGRKTQDKHNIVIEAIEKFNRLTDFIYETELQEQILVLYKTGYEEKVDLAIFDDVFPTKLSPFRYVEYDAYLRQIPNAKAFCSGFSLHLLTDKSIGAVISEYKIENTQFSNQLIRWPTAALPIGVSPKLAYFCFIQNVWAYLESVEKLAVPFVFELYPGGTFSLNNTFCNEMLCGVFSSPFFRKVIVTQKVAHDYLLDNHFCSEDAIVDIFGVVTPQEKLNTKMNAIHYGKDKQEMDICFAAFRYMEKGEDKGYDIFVAVAIKLAEKFDNIRFHVVGGFDASVLDVSALGDRITFYGKQPPEWFEKFYQDKDIILSPNIHNKLAAGSFDGFPTASCTEAALCETAMFCTDLLKMNDGYFVPGEEIVILDHDVDDVVEKVSYYHDHPFELKELCIKGKEKVKALYAYGQQMKPRISLLNEEIAASDENEKEIFKKYQSPFKQHAFGISSLYCDVGRGFCEEDKLNGKIKWFDNNHFTVWFSLNSFTERVQRIRFDPTEATAVKCKNITAASASGALELIPAYSVLHDGWDCFLSADSQYISFEIKESVQGVLKIEGEIEVLHSGEIQQIIDACLSAKDKEFLAHDESSASRKKHKLFKQKV